MHRWFRIALMCLLVVALPMRGWAASTMTHCGPSHQQMAAQAVDESHAHHLHEGTPVAAADMSHAVDASSGDPHGLHKSSQFKCSACASCCVGTGLPSAIQTVQIMDTPHSAWPAMTPAAGVFLTAGLDRPPRFRRT